jgi:hypothetical protein
MANSVTFHWLPLREDALSNRSLEIDFSHKDFQSFPQSLQEILGSCLKLGYRLLFTFFLVHQSLTMLPTEDVYLSVTHHFGAV